jgi:FlgD Ig-like domain
MARPLVRAVFALLVVATIAAFFVTQQLKSEDALVLRFAAKPQQFSPNGDGTRDRSEVGFDLSRPATVSFYVLDREGAEIRRIVDDRALAGDTKHRFTWDGRDDDGVPVPDGFYRMRVVQRSEGRVINSSKRIRVDRKPPDVALVEAAPGVIAPREPGQEIEVVVRYRGPSNSAPEFRVFRTDVAGEPLVVRRFRGNESRRGVWHGEVASGPEQTEPAPDGDYAFTVTVRDRAGNPVVAPEEIPRPSTARHGTGVSVRSFTLSGPLEVVPPGSAATLEVGPVDRSFDFVMSRYGDPEPIRRGGRIAGEFRVHVPSDARTGLYLVRVRAGDHRAVWPLAVAGLPQSRRAAERPRPLLVLPAMSWQGLNSVDDDLDGFADSLPDGRSVGLTRPFRGGGLPPRFASEVGPLLRYLDREGLAYDLTTDVSLARGEGPSLGNAPGVALAGSALWLPEPLMRRLRDEVEDGLRVASFGADALRRTVRLERDRLTDPSERRGVDAFGEGTGLLRTSSAPLTVFEDGLGLFEDLDEFIGDFTVFEESSGLPTDSRPIATAGRDPRRPAFVAFGLGGGLVIRSGTPQWARELEEERLGEEVPLVTKRIWRLLAQGAR